jgi:hypothetical protein
LGLMRASVIPSMGQQFAMMSFFHRQFPGGRPALAIDPLLVRP